MEYAGMKNIVPTDVVRMVNFDKFRNACLKEGIDDDIIDLVWNILLNFKHKQRK